MQWRISSVKYPFCQSHIAMQWNDELGNRCDLLKVANLLYGWLIRHVIASSRSVSLSLGSRDWVLICSNRCALCPVARQQPNFKAILKICTPNSCLRLLWDNMIRRLMRYWNGRLMLGVRMGNWRVRSRCLSHEHLYYLILVNLDAFIYCHTRNPSPSTPLGAMYCFMVFIEQYPNHSLFSPMLLVALPILSHFEAT